jgi:predicted tellurium resistance membrane protein TerC
MEWITDPQAWIALLTLTSLEIVLGIDNIIFISILSGRLPEAQRARARTMGLAAAMGTRILLLASLAWLAHLTAELFTVGSHAITARDLVLVAGGLFLLARRRSRSTTTSRATSTRAGPEEGDFVRGRHRADHGAGHRLLARLGDHRDRHGRPPAGDDRRRGHRRAGDDGQRPAPSAASSRITPR